MTDRFAVIPASYVLLRKPADNDQILLQLRQNTGYKDGYWSFSAAGHVEVGESIFAAAIREAKEELGITVADHQLTPITAMHRTGGTKKLIDERVDFFFECDQWDGEPTIIEPHKVAELRWFSLHDLPELVPAHELDVLDQLRTNSIRPFTALGF